jgi:hypothetical protein
VDITQEEQQDLWRLRAEWIGVYNIGRTDTGRWYAQRLDPWGEGSTAWLYADIAADLGAKLDRDYAEKVLRS